MLTQLLAFGGLARVGHTGLLELFARLLGKPALKTEALENFKKAPKSDPYDFVRTLLPQPACLMRRPIRPSPRLPERPSSMRRPDPACRQSSLLQLLGRAVLCHRGLQNDRDLSYSGGMWGTLSDPPMSQDWGVHECLADV